MLYDKKQVKNNKDKLKKSQVVTFRISGLDLAIYNRVKRHNNMSQWFKNRLRIDFGGFATESDKEATLQREMLELQRERDRLNDKYERRLYALANEISDLRKSLR